MIDENWGKPTTPRQILEHHAMVALSDPRLSSRLRGNTAMDCIATGKEIPEAMLPGRYIMTRMNARERDAMSRLTSEDTVSGGLYYAKTWLTWEPPPHPRWGAYLSDILEFDKKIVNRRGY